MDPVCVVNIRQADKDKVVEVERGLFNLFRPFSRTHSLYVARLAKIPRPPTRRTEIDHRMNEVEEQLADHVDRIRHMVRQRCQRYNISTTDSIYDHDPFLTGRGQLSPNMSLALSPNIWFQCRSGWVKDIIQKEIGGISWTQHYGLGNKIHVGLPAAVLATNPSTPVPRGLRFDHSGFKLPYDYELFLNIQKPLGDSPASACGLMCSVTVKKGDTLVHHSTCKIGGLLSIKDSNGIDHLVGLTSGHALLDMYLTTDMEGKGIISSPGPEPGKIPWPSLLSWLLDSKGSVKQRGATTPTSVEEDSSTPSKDDLDEEQMGDSHWEPVNGIYSINWMGGGWESIEEFHFPFEVSQPERLCPDADFALLQLSGEFHSAFHTISSGIQHVFGFKEEAEITSEKVHVILGPDNVVQGMVLWSRQNLHVRGTRFLARKIQLEEPLSIGVSGSWVVQDGLLCGMIALIYEDEPFAYMITAEKLISDIMKTLGPKSEVSLPQARGYTSEHEKKLFSPVPVPFEGSNLENRGSSLRPKSETDMDFEDRKPFFKMTEDLHQESISSAVNDHFFIPLDVIHRATQHDMVHKELMKIFPETGEAERLCDYIRTTAKKLFVALLLVDKAKVIRDCFYENIHDSDLPLILRSDSEGQGDCLFERSNVDKSDGVTTTQLISFREWNQLNLRRFQRSQFGVLAPFFTLGANGQPLFYKLRPDTVLPFTESIRFDGRHPLMTKARIHPAHHDFCISGSGYVAVKQLSAPWSNTAYGVVHTYRSELEAHGRLYREPRLCTMIAAIEYDGIPSIVMPWADGGSLYDLWERHSQAPPATRAFLQWFMRECLGLAQGISAIHSPRILEHVQGLESLHPDVEAAELLEATRFLDKERWGRHGDIQPGNILCFYEGENDTPTQADYGVLKLSDFETTSFESSWELSETNCRLTLTFEAPEMRDGASITPLSDIWSFGCVLLEFTSWLLLGLAGVQSFTDARLASWVPSKPNIYKDDCFFSANENQNEVRPSVRAWISMLHRECRLREAHGNVLEDFLAYIEDHLLVVDAEKRDNAADSVNALTHLFSRLDEPESPILVQPDTSARSDVDLVSVVPDTCQPEVEATDVFEILHAGSTKDGQAVIMASRSEHPVPASEHEQLEESVVQTIEEHIEEIRTKEAYTRRTQRRTTVFNANRAALLTRAALAQRALEGKSVGQSKEEMLATLRLLPAGELAEEQANLEMRLEAISELQREAQQMAVKEGAGIS